VRRNIVVMIASIVWSVVVQTSHGVIDTIRQSNNYHSQYPVTIGRSVLLGGGFPMSETQIQKLNWLKAGNEAVANKFDEIIDFVNGLDASLVLQNTVLDKLRDDVTSIAEKQRGDGD